MQAVSCSAPRSFSLSVRFERRNDGGLRVFSDDLPGFVLSHADADAVLSDVRPTLEAMLRAVLRGDVVVSELVGLREALKNAGVVSSDPLGGRAVRTYVAHLC